MSHLSHGCLHNSLKKLCEIGSIVAQLVALSSMCHPSPLPPPIPTKPTPWIRLCAFVMIAMTVFFGKRGVGDDAGGGGGAVIPAVASRLVHANAHSLVHLSQARNPNSSWSLSPPQLSGITCGHRSGVDCYSQSALTPGSSARTVSRNSRSSPSRCRSPARFIAFPFAPPVEPIPLN